MGAVAGTGSGASSPQGQTPSAETTEWQQERARLQAELNGRDQQIRALSTKNQAWERNVGKELEGHLEFDTFGNPVRVRVDDYGNQRTQTVIAGQHPLTGLVENTEAFDQYLGNRFGQQFATPQQLQQLVNQAKLEAYNAARGDFMTLRSVDKTISDKRYSELSNFESPLSKKTQDVLQRNGWGQPSQAGVSSWDAYRYSDPNALSIAAQIAKSELFESQQQSQESQSQAQAAAGAAGISGTGSAASATATTRSPEEMAKLFSENPTEYDRILKESFDRSVGGSGR